MSGELLLLGASHRTAPVEERERVAVPEERIPELLQGVVQAAGADEAAIVSTCNRVEWLVATRDPERLRTHFKARFGVGDDWLQRHAYTHHGADALRHLFRVSSSLDSLVLGESQILGQVKEAFARSTGTGTAGPVLHRVFSQALKVAKRVRTETGIAEHAVSISFAAVELARKVFGKLDGKRVLVVGAGKMGGLAVRHLIQAGARQVDICNRSLDNARRLAQELHGTPHGLDALPQLLSEVDIVISSTGAQSFVIRYDQLREVVARRRFRPLFMIDIAVPRDIEPRCDQLQNVFLFDVDDLERVVDANLRTRQLEAAKAERIVEDEVASMQRWFAEHAVVPTIVELREKLTRIRDAEVEKLLRGGALTPEAREAVEKVTLQLVNKILHEPTVALRQASAGGSQAPLVNAVHALFALGDGNNANDEAARVAGVAERTRS